MTDSQFAGEGREESKTTNAVITRLDKNSKASIKSPKRRLHLEYSGNLIKHLGLSMYGGPVPALAELIANAWDADAHRVTLTLPLDKPISESDRIVVYDDGRGMTWEEVERDYLVIGRNRRHRGGNLTRQGRPIMGRKGIGKLAGFGIAKIVEVRTIRNRWLTHFRMNYDDMTSDLAPRARYEPEILADESTNEKNSTTVTLEGLQLKRAIPAQSFRDSLSRRFAVLDDTFIVKVNGQPLRKAEMPMAFRYPKKPGTTAEYNVPNFGKIRYWYGFTTKPIANEDARGLSIYTRGRMASVPSMFGITGGVWNQAALEYLTGEVLADELDQEEDFINTNRQSINWRESRTAALQEWGQKIIRDAARQYSELKRAQTREKLISQLDSGKQATVKAHLARLPDRIARVANKLIGNYHAAAQGSSSSNVLESAIDNIVALSEAAVPISKQRDALSDMRSVVAQRRSVLDELSVVPKREQSRILRANPWIFLSPWRLAVNDAAITAAAEQARSNYASLTKTLLWVIAFENQRYLISIGDSSPKAEKALVSIVSRLERQRHAKRLSVIMLAPESRPSEDHVRVTTISVLIERGVRDCEALLRVLDAQLSLAT